MGRFGNHHQAAGAAVKPVHRTVDKSFRTAIIRKHRVFQRIVRMPRAGLAGQGSRLVYHQQILILIGDGQGQVIGAQLIHRGGFRPAHGHGLPGMHHRVHPGGFTVQQDAPVPFGRLHGRIADPHASAQNVPQPAALLRFPDDVIHAVPSFLHREYSGKERICPWPRHLLRLAENMI